MIQGEWWKRVVEEVNVVRKEQSNPTQHIVAVAVSLMVDYVSRSLLVRLTAATLVARRQGPRIPVLPPPSSMDHHRDIKDIRSILL